MKRAGAGVRKNRDMKNDLAKAAGAKPPKEDKPDKGVATNGRQMIVMGWKDFTIRNPDYISRHPGGTPDEVQRIVDELILQSGYAKVKVAEVCSEWTAGVKRVYGLPYDQAVPEVLRH